jgi:hypothetical protein
VIHDLRRAFGGPPARRIPAGILASTLVVLVVVGATLLPKGVPVVPPPATPAGSVSQPTTEPVATPIVPNANRVAWLQKGADGSISLVFADIDHACPDADPACAPLVDSSPAPLALAGPPKAVVLSPGSDQLAVVGSDSETAGSVLVVDVPAPKPSPGPSSTPGVSAPPATPPASATPSAFPTVGPGASASPAPGTVRAIISGVTVVGSVAYSDDGRWLAFSARPRDGSAGPDLYVWHVGDVQATRLTADGETFFAGWFGNRILASGIVADEPSDGASPDPGATETPAAEASGEPSSTPQESTGASEVPASPPSPESSPSGLPVEAHPYSFLLDPATGARTAFSQPDVWLPSIDPTGRFVTYWSGTVMPVGPAADGPFTFGLVLAWGPASGHLVLDGWSAPLAELPTPSPSEDASPVGGSPAVTSPAVGPESPTVGPESPSPAPTIGPAGTPIELAAGPIADFDARFDGEGTRLAVWVLDSPDSSAGRLWLLALDPDAGAVDRDLHPMDPPGVQALRGFTIGTGRLAWATPAGQDGQPSTVQVLAWKGDEFGQVKSVPGGNPQIVR